LHKDSLCKDRAIQNVDAYFTNPMSKIDAYRETLKSLDDWIPYLLQESGLPGPRGNLELAHAVAQAGSREQFETFLSVPLEQAPTNNPHEFLVFCGVLGLGKLAAKGDHTQIARLQSYASDQRWRVREGVATALQLLGDVDMPLLLREMSAWSKGNWLEKRAAAAALAEPRLLKQTEVARDALETIEAITVSMADAENRSGDEFKTLRQAMGYCWSVLVAALPDEGKKSMEKWLASEDKDIRWIMRENLKKNRLLKAAPLWVATWQEKIKV
jgi:hypothetical protein